MQILKSFSLFAVVALVGCGGATSPSNSDSPNGSGIEDDDDSLIDDADEEDCPRPGNVEPGGERGLTEKHEGACACGGKAGKLKIVIRHDAGSFKGPDAGRRCIKHILINARDGGPGCVCPPGMGQGGTPPSPM